VSFSAVISDFGGVLTTPLVGSFLAFQEEVGITSESLGKAMQRIAEADGEHPLFELEMGKITEAVFLDRMASELETEVGHRPQMHRFSEIYFDALKPNPPMIELMRELKARPLRMALLTNNVKEWEPRWRAMLPIDELFESVTDSGFVGTRKPEARIFEITYERIVALEGLADVKREECVLVDDIAINCDAAIEFGFQAVRYHGANSDVLAELKPLLV
jgi:putative hydrolase of the HAD superfamily